MFDYLRLLKTSLNFSRTSFKNFFIIDNTKIYDTILKMREKGDDVAHFGVMINQKEEFISQGIVFPFQLLKLIKYLFFKNSKILVLLFFLHNFDNQVNPLRFKSNK